MKNEELIDLLDELEDSLVDCQNDPDDLAEWVLKTLYDRVCSIVTQYEQLKQK